VTLRSATLGLLFACAASCNRYTYEYNDGEYPTPAALYAAQIEHYERLLRTVQPLPAPLVPRCRVFVPRRQVLERNAVFHTAAPQREVEVLAESVRLGLLFNVQVLKKRRLCGAMTIAESDGGHVLPLTLDTYLYAHNADEGLLEWFVVEHGNKPRMLPGDRRILDAEQSIQDWLTRVESRLVRHP
jgi:hypothetical protein